MKEIMRRVECTNLEGINDLLGEKGGPIVIEEHRNYNTATFIPSYNGGHIFPKEERIKEGYVIYSHEGYLMTSPENPITTTIATNISIHKNCIISIGELKMVKDIFLAKFYKNASNFHKNIENNLVSSLNNISTSNYLVWDEILSS